MGALLRDKTEVTELLLTRKSPPLSPTVFPYRPTVFLRFDSTSHTLSPSWFIYWSAVQCANVNKIRTPVHASTLHYAVLINTLMVSFLNIFGLQCAIINYTYICRVSDVRALPYGPGFYNFFFGPLRLKMWPVRQTPHVFWFVNMSELSCEGCVYLLHSIGGGDG